MDVSALIDRYCEAWTDPAPARRAALIASVWAESATYADPSAQATGADGLLSHIAAVQARRPGAKILRTGAVDAHHGVARFARHLVQPDGTALPGGLDIAFLTPDRAKIERIVGFFGPLGTRAETGA